MKSGRSVRYNAAFALLGAAAVVAAIILWNMIDAPAAADEAKVIPQQPQVVAASVFEAGRYLVKVAGCNDCHTAGYLMSGGNVPEEKWLLGDPLGWRGPWGTTYPSNLRFFAKDYDPELLVQVLRERKERPPMPWMNLHAMSDADLKAIFHYIRSFEDVGEPVPEWVPPDREPTTPFISLIPQFPPGFGGE